MSRIHFSDYYLDTLKSTLAIIKKVETNKEVLLFKHEDEVFLSKMNSNIWVNLRTNFDNVKFDDDEIGIISLEEFHKYLVASGYPKNPASKIEVKDAKTSLGNVFSTYMITGNGIKYHVPSHSPILFKQPYDRKVPGKREDDKLQLVAKFNITKEQVKFLADNKKLLNISLDATFGLKVVDSKIDITMKSLSNRQFDYEFTEIDFIDPEYTTINSKGTHKLYNSQFFDYLSYYKCDFEIELRYSSAHDVLAIKAYSIANRPTKSEVNTSDIGVLIGTHESKAKQISDQFEIFE
jgi:hypothetical protein